MAEAHPVGFQWVMEAKRRGATVIHVDPRFTRTSARRRPARPDPGRLRHRVPRRPGQPRAEQRPRLPRVRRRLHQRREPHRRATSRDTEDLDGLFSGFDPETGHYDPTTLALPAARGHGRGRAAARARSSKRDEAAGAEQQASHQAARSESHGSGGAPVSLEGRRDETLQDPRCVFQILKRHFARYTPEMVQEVCGIEPEQFRAGGRRAHQQQRARADRRLLLRGRAGRTTASARR